MKRKIELDQVSSAEVGSCTPEPAQEVGEPGEEGKPRISERFRLLEWNEVVSHGDFVADEDFELKPWEGPSGFRADAFVRQIYRATAIHQPHPRRRADPKGSKT